MLNRDHGHLRQDHRGLRVRHTAADRTDLAGRIDLGAVVADAVRNPDRRSLAAVAAGTGSGRGSGRSLGCNRQGTGRRSPAGEAPGRATAQACKGSGNYKHGHDPNEQQQYLRAVAEGTDFGLASTGREAVGRTPVLIVAGDNLGLAARTAAAAEAGYGRRPRRSNRSCSCR